MAGDPDPEIIDDERYWYNSAWQLVQVDKMTTALATDVWYVYKQFVWDVRYIDSPVYRMRDTSADGNGTYNSLDELLYYLTDANMNVTAVMDADATTWGGFVVERYTYDPYGRVTAYDDDFSNPSAPSGNVDNRILFAGYRYDAETGLYHARNRFYHPLLGRWTSRDPAGYVDGPSLYQYVRSNPTIAIDPSGMILSVYSGHQDTEVGDDDETLLVTQLEESLQDMCPCVSVEFIEHYSRHVVGGVEVDDRFVARKNSEYDTCAKFSACAKTNAQGCALLYRILQDEQDIRVSFGTGSEATDSSHVRYDFSQIEASDIQGADDSPIDLSDPDMSDGQRASYERLLRVGLVAHELQHLYDYNAGREATDAMAVTMNDLHGADAPLAERPWINEEPEGEVNHFRTWKESRAVRMQNAVMTQAAAGLGLEGVTGNRTTHTADWVGELTTPTTPLPWPSQLSDDDWANAWDDLENVWGVPDGDFGGE